MTPCLEDTINKLLPGASEGQAGHPGSSWTEMLGSLITWSYFTDVWFVSVMDVTGVSPILTEHQKCLSICAHKPLPIPIRCCGWSRLLLTPPTSEIQPGKAKHSNHITMLRKAAFEKSRLMIVQPLATGHFRARHESHGGESTRKGSNPKLGQVL